MKMFLLLSFLLTTQAFAGWSISHYNIRNFNKDPDAGPTNIAQLSKNIRAAKSDVMSFNEVVNVPAFEQLLKIALPGYFIAVSSCGGFGQQKIAIAFNPKVFKFISYAEDLTFSSGGTTCGDLRPGLFLNLQHLSNGKMYTFAGFHLKAGGEEAAMRKRWTQYKLLAQLAQKYASKNLVIMGDLNTTGYNIKDADYDQFQSFLSVSKFATASQNLACTSYWEGTLGNGLHQSSILDHIVLKNDMAREVANVSVGAHCAKLDCRDATPADLGIDYASVSDHCPIQVTFK